MLVLVAACSSDDTPVASQTTPAVIAPTAIVEPAAAPEPTAAMEAPAMEATAVMEAPAMEATAAMEAPAMENDGSAMMTGPTTIALGTNGTLGSFLVDGEGRTLYLFTNDERNASNCAGGCAAAWPPLHTNGDPMVLDGLDSERAGTITREDGRTQHTYNGWPLYHFASDETPGDTNGQDRGGVWFVVSADGGPIRTSAVVDVAENVTLGTILVDDSGRSLYLFTNDVVDTSNCAGGCALAWPPLLTVDAPTAEAGVTNSLLGTIMRNDGSMQVTYNGLPLYYFAADDKPGDANGQNRGDVWFVISPEGEAVPAS